MKWLMPVLLLLIASISHAGEKTMKDAVPIYSIPVEPMKESRGTSNTLAQYAGKPMLIVNVASKCGYTKQYEGLEKLYRKYKDQGLAVLGFPSNDFGGQEPGTEQEIVEFCKTKYDVTFPLYGKLHAKGEEISPLYKYLTAQPTEEKGEVAWNFEKFLVSRDGKIVGRYRSKVTPEDPELTKAIERELAAKK